MDASSPLQTAPVSTQVCTEKHMEGTVDVIVIVGEEGEMKPLGDSDNTKTNEEKGGKKSLDDSRHSDHTKTAEEDGKKLPSDESSHTKTVADNPPAPNSLLCQQIIKQVEYYFSDANLENDHFLRSRMRRSKAKLGFVSLNLIANFKRMKALTKDMDIIVYSLRQSEELEVNEEGTEVRSRKPPQFDGTFTDTARTIVAVNLGLDNPNVHSVKELFKHCGDLGLVRVLRPGQSVPPDVAKFAYSHPEIGFSVCALVEFKKQEQAIHACQTMTNNKDWRCGMRVMLLDKNSKRKQQEKREIDTTQKQPKAQNKERISNCGKKKKATHVNSSGSISDGNNSGEAQDSDHGTTVDLNPKHAQRRHSSKLPSEASSGKHHIHNHDKAIGSGRQSLQNVSLNDGAHQSSRVKSSTDHKLQVKSCQQDDPSPSSNPWLQRRLQAAQSSGAGMGVGSVLNMVGVSRNPRGPDGTKGFYGDLVEEDHKAALSHPIILITALWEGTPKSHPQVKIEMWDPWMPDCCIM